MSKRSRAATILRISKGGGGVLTVKTNLNAAETPIEKRVFKDTPPAGTDKMYSAVMPKEGNKYVYDQSTGERIEVPMNRTMPDFTKPVPERPMVQPEFKLKPIDPVKPTPVLPVKQETMEQRRARISAWKAKIKEWTKAKKAARMLRVKK